MAIDSTTLIPDTIIECNEGRNLLIERAEENKNQISYVLRFSPSLSPGEKATLSSPLSWASKKQTFAMNRKDLDKKHQVFEYSSIRISYPSNRIEMEIIFSPGFMPIEESYDVWLGPGQVRNKREYERLRQNGAKNFQCITEKASHKRHIKLSVDYPLYGNVYAITWARPK